MSSGAGLRAAAVLAPVLLVPLLGATFLVGLAHAEVANRIVATIDGEPITAYELRRYAREHDAEGASESQILEAVITDKLLDQEIKAQGISARDDEIDRYVKEVQGRNGMDDEAFARALAAKGITVEVYRAKVKREIEKAQLVNKEIRQRVNVSPEEIRRHYEAHRTDYEVAEKVKVRHILFTVDRGADQEQIERVRAKAVEVRGLATSGRDFQELARQFSEGPGSDKGGELGTFSKGELSPELEAVVFRLKTGEVSEPVRSPSGFHLLLVDERISSSHRPLEEVSDKIRDELYNGALEERFQNWLSRDLRERHHVEVLN
jgi:peptidyl-prolyl cis-trans isomerase SurA